MRNCSRLVLMVLCLLALLATWAVAEEVSVKPSKVSLPKSSAVMKNRTVTLTPVLSPATATTTYHWSSSRRSVATVVDGVVTGVKPGKAVITVRTANNKKATCRVTVTQVSMTGFSIAVTDYLGYDCYDEDDDVFWEVTGHRMYAQIGDVEPADANQSLIWKSSNPKVATVSSKGTILCKKAGTATITAKAKYGGTRQILPVTVYANETRWTTAQSFADLDEYDEDCYYSAAKRIYIKDGHLYIDMYILNMNSFAIRRMSKQQIYLTLAYSEAGDWDDYTYVGSYKPVMKGKINPRTIGTVTFRLGKVTASKIWLTNADAYCTGTCYSKSLGAEPKATIPGMSGASRLARRAA